MATASTSARRECRIPTDISCARPRNTTDPRTATTTASSAFPSPSSAAAAGGNAPTYPLSWRLSFPVSSAPSRRRRRRRPSRCRGLVVLPRSPPPGRSRLALYAFHGTSRGTGVVCCRPWRASSSRTAGGEGGGAAGHSGVDGGVGGVAWHPPAQRAGPHAPTPSRCCSATRRRSVAIPVD